jgi:branched-chain amino acid transport system substrate-binding protein
VTALVLTLGLFGCVDGGTDLPPAGDGTMRIVSSLTYKGYTAKQARQIEQAIRLAIEQDQQLSANLEYIPLDNSDPETGDWSREREIENASKAASDPTVIAYVGPYQSGAVMSSLAITNKAGLLQVSPSATWPGLTEDGYNPGEPDIYFPGGRRTFLALMPSDSMQGKAAAKWAAQLALKKIVVLEDGSTYSAGLAKRFSESFDGVLAPANTINPMQLSDIPAQVGAADAVFYAPSSVQNAVLLAKALAPLDVQVIASDVALDPQFLDGAGSDAGGWHVVANSVPPDQLYGSSQDAEAFRQNFERANGETPGQFAANAYFFVKYLISTLATLEAISPEALPARGEVLSYMMSGERQWEQGNLKFGGDGRPISSSLSGYTWRDGHFVVDTILTVDP